jgi:hypothetical protein
VHESIAMQDGFVVGELRGELQHYAYRDIGHHLATMDRYTTLAAEQMYEDGRRASLTDLIVNAPAAFARNYLLRRGIADGIPGLIISSMNSHYVFLKFAKLWAMEQRARSATSAAL